MDYSQIILAAAKAAKISGAMLLAVCMHETGLNNVTVEQDGGSPTYGLCQVKYNTAKMLGYQGPKEGLKSPKENAKWAAIYLKYQYKRYAGNWCKSISAYNAGSYVESLKEPGHPRNLKYVMNVKKKLSTIFQKNLSCDMEYASVP